MKYKLKTGGYGFLKINIPKTIKGKKVVPNVYKVREDSKGKPYAVVGLYTWNKRNKSYSKLLKNKVVRLSKRK